MIQLHSHFQTIQSKINSFPNKLKFKIGEVANLLDVPSHVLRYWEKEFSILNPEKFINKQRLYTKKDLEVLLLIKLLLYKEKFSIEGLRKHLPSYYQKWKNRTKEEINLIPIKAKVSQLLVSISEIKSALKS